MWLPDDQQGFIDVAARAAIAAIRRYPGAWVYSTAPPASVHLAALRAARETGTTWVAEFRDPWTDNPGKPWYARTAITDWIERGLERRCLSRADLVVSVSEGIDGVLRRKVPLSAHNKFIVALNGIEPRLNAVGTSPPRRPLRIVHVGTLYLGRDPRPFLCALARVVQRRKLEPSDIQAEFIGDAESFNGIPVRDLVRAAGLANHVTFTPWLPHAEAQDQIRNASALLLLAEGQPLQIPHKLYEYLAARRPILAFADREGDTASLVRRSGRHWVVSGDDPAAIDDALDALVQSQGQGTEFNEAYLAGIQTSAQVAGLWRAVARTPSRLGHT
jgi:glycosyltransferase involved in cell wall biosynthesis